LETIFSNFFTQVATSKAHMIPNLSIHSKTQIKFVT